jgi:hypothetical protein
MVKELTLLKIVVPDEFIVGGIIAKLPLLWRDFTTALKHKRVRMSISDLITSLDVEGKAQAKDGRSKGVDGQTSANLMHLPRLHGKDKAKQNQNNNKPNQITTFKKKKNNKEEEDCFVCRSPNHWKKKYPNRKERKYQSEQKTANMVVSSSGDETSVYDNLSSVLSVFQSTS